MVYQPMIRAIFAFSDAVVRYLATPMIGLMLAAIAWASIWGGVHTFGGGL